MYHTYLVHTKMHVGYIITPLDNGLERKKGQVMQNEAKGILKLDFFDNFLKISFLSQLYDRKYPDFIQQIFNFNTTSSKLCNASSKHDL